MRSLRSTLALAFAAAVLWTAWRVPAASPREPRRVPTRPARALSAGTDEARADARAESPSARTARPDAATRSVLASLPEPLPSTPPTGEDAPTDMEPPSTPTTATAAPGGDPSEPREETTCGTGEVLIGPAGRAPGPSPVRLAGADPGLRALEKLGLDVEHPDETLRRLVEEYRASLEATEPDSERMALVDQAMAAIVRNYAETVDDLFTLFVQERNRAMGRYLAYLLRDVKRVEQEPPLLLMAAADPDEGRRANALTSIAPARNEAGIEVLLGALQDPSPAVRLASAEAIETSLVARPGMREGIEARIEEVRSGETDEGVAGVLARVSSGL